MDPFSALIFAIIVTHVVFKAAGQAAADQARTEADRARETIRRDLARRRTVASERLNRRLADARRVGPRAGWWWAWAAIRTGSALRRAYRQRRRPAEQRQRPIRSTNGPFGRILGAAWRGGQYAWEDLRRQREDGAWPRTARQPRPVDTGVCERCGAVVAAAALSEGLTRHGRKARMCWQCHARCGAERQADAAASAPAAAQEPDDGIVDATPAITPSGEVCDLCPDQPPHLAGECVRYPEERDTRPYLDRAADEDLERQRRQRNLDELDSGDAQFCYWCGSGTAGMRPCAGHPGKWECTDAEACRRRSDTGEDPAVACVRCGSVIRAFCCTNPCCPLSWRNVPLPAADPGADAPTQFRLPVRNCTECSTQLAPSTWWAVNATNADVCLFCARNHPAGACRQRSPIELAALGDPLDDDGKPAEIPPGLFRTLGEEAARIAVEAAKPGPTDPPPDDPAGSQAPKPAPTPDEGDGMSCEMHSQAAWAAAAESVQNRVTAIVQSAENMLRSLSAKNAGRGHIAMAKSWHDRVGTVLGRGDALIADVNHHQDPYVDAVQGAGGSGEVADPDFYDEM